MFPYYYHETQGATPYWPGPIRLQAIGVMMRIKMHVNTGTLLFSELSVLMNTGTGRPTIPWTRLSHRFHTICLHPFSQQAHAYVYGTILAVDPKVGSKIAVTRYTLAIIRQLTFKLTARHV